MELIFEGVFPAGQFSLRPHLLNPLIRSSRERPLFFFFRTFRRCLSFANGLSLSSKTNSGGLRNGPSFNCKNISINVITPAQRMKLIWLVKTARQSSNSQKPKVKPIGNVPRIKSLSLTFTFTVVFAPSQNFENKSKDITKHFQENELLLM